VFPEGLTTNGTGIMSFKKGALLSERSLKPVCLVYDQEGPFSSAYDLLSLGILIILNLCKFGMKVKVLELPPF
jgi:hypothetical protein